MVVIMNIVQPQEALQKKKDRKFDNSQTFFFPQSSEGIESVRSVFELMSLIESKLDKAFKNRPQIRCEYQYSFPRFYSYIQGLEFMKLVAHCKFCSTAIIYFKDLSFEQSFKLIKFNNIHVHTRDPKKIRQAYFRSSIDAPRIYRYQPYVLKMMKMKNEWFKPGMSPEEYFKSLPIFIKLKTKQKLIYDKFGFTESEFNSMVRLVDKEYNITLKELFQQFDQKDFTYSYLPKNILDVEERHNVEKALPKFSFSPNDFQPDCEQFHPDPNSIHFVDECNPNLPNILIIVTPQMKQLYKQFGQYIGFDLTFSIIKQKPTHHKQYLTGVFAGTNESKRILVYGTIITNSQSVPAYKYIFTEFFRIMGKQPTAIITDEEKPIYYALKELRDQGVYHGSHLLDMFHVLKKFRKTTDGNNFQLYRKILHVTDRYQYRRRLRELQRQIFNDKQLDTLRLFDLNADKYCFAHIPSKMVGYSISNAFNEKFHDVIKSTIPYETKYIRSVKVIAEVIVRMNQLKEPDIQMYPLQENLNIQWLKPYRTLFSAGTFRIIVRAVSRAGNYVVLTEEEERRENLVAGKVEGNEPQVCSKVVQSFNKNSYIIKTKLGSFKVFKKYDSSQVLINQHASKSTGKWYCYCEYQQKTGVLCSHLAKILIHLGEDFMKNIHPRWVIKEATLTKRMTNYRYMNNFSQLRSRNRTRVKGYKKSKYVFDNFHRNGQAQEGNIFGLNSEEQSVADQLDLKGLEEEFSEFGDTMPSEYESTPNTQYKGNQHFSDPNEYNDNQQCMMEESVPLSQYFQQQQEQMDDDFKNEE